MKLFNETRYNKKEDSAEDLHSFADENQSLLLNPQSKNSVPENNIEKNKKPPREDAHSLHGVKDQTQVTDRSAAARFSDFQGSSDISSIAKNEGNTNPPEHLY